MIDFNKHSLKNYTYDDVKAWLSSGLEKVAKIMDVDASELRKFVKNQEDEILLRKQHPTIDDMSDERRTLRRNILADYINLYENARKDKKAVIVLGQIASGKSSYCKMLECGGENAIVDVDFIKQGHGFMRALADDFDGGKGTDMIHEEASMLSKEYLNMMSNYGYNLVIPKTGIEYASIDKIVRLLKTKGYDTMLCYIDLPIEKCVERNFYRFIDEYRRGIPSRLVPYETIRKIDDKPFKTFSKFLMDRSPYVDHYAAFSNDVEPGEDMIRIDLKDILEYAKLEEEEDKGD